MQTNNRLITYAQAINEAIYQCMDSDPSVYLMGLGVPDPKGIFGSTQGLQNKFGQNRVLDMPVSENGMTGVSIGSALTGMRPIMTHQRIDFALLAMEQIANQASNWHYMFGGKSCVPIVIRLIIGRGWGQGPQHSQSLQSWFAHIPGLKVIMPTTPYDVKGLLISSINDNNPVIFIEHRWLYNISGYVPQSMYDIQIGKPKIVKEGNDITIAATSYMTLEALKASEILTSMGIHAEVIDVRTLKPLDYSIIMQSVRKTGRFVAVDTGWKTLGFASELVARITETVFDSLKSRPVRITLPDCPTPTSPELAKSYYPRALDIVDRVQDLIGKRKSIRMRDTEHSTIPIDVPDKSFTGPF